MGEPGGAEAHIVVVANEKGGTGKSTTAMHLIAGFLREGNAVASIDLDSDQGSLTRYVENRQAFCDANRVPLPRPDHTRFRPEDVDGQPPEAAFDALLARLARENDIVVIDCPGGKTTVSRHALGFADTLVTPLNDSFVDMDVLGVVEDTPPKVVRPSHFAETVFEARKGRARRDGGAIDWIVLRNRLSQLESRNKQYVGAALDELARRIGFRQADGFGERVIFRELFVQGLTVLDLRDPGTEMKLSMSHVAARQEIRRLMDAMKLPGRRPVGAEG